TTRIEDQAYSLMGLFNVNMPLMYGEGNKAFLRLQQEIARTSEDESLFAWHDNTAQSGMFATSILDFYGCQQYRPYHEAVIARPPYTITNRGLAMVSDCQEHQQDHSLFLGQEGDKFLLLPLNCSRDGSTERPFTIVLRAVSPGIYVRWHPGEIFVFEKYMQHFSRQESRTIYIRDPQVLADQRQRTASTLVLCNPPSLPRCPAPADNAPLHSFVTPPGSASYSLNTGFRISLEGWTGFAVIEFSIDEVRTVTIVLAHCATLSNLEPGDRIIMLETLIHHEDPKHPDYLSFKTILDACYERPDPANAPSLKSQLGLGNDPMPDLATLELQRDGSYELKTHLDKASDLRLPTSS
ncbi:MAG: hypothetical protein Q9183_007305, partial [Haloplaca sp. 2 TL-2023]